MDIEEFNKYTAQLQSMLGKLVDDEQTLQMIRQRQLADSGAVNACITQVAVEKQLRKMANDIRALGFCYNKMKASIVANSNAEQLDTTQ